LLLISLKDTGHILGLLSREGDSTGPRDIGALAPTGVKLRAPLKLGGTQAAVTVPAAILEVKLLDSANPLVREQIIRCPASGIVASDGTASNPVAGDKPTVTFHPHAGVIDTFDLALTAPAPSKGLRFLLAIEEAAPVANRAPERRIVKGEIPAGTPSVLGVPIDPASLQPGIDIHLAVFIEGRALAFDSQTLLP
jgi:hypothetical protein